MIPGWVLVPVVVADVMPSAPTIRDVSMQALEWKRGALECNARIDYLRDIQDSVE